MVVSGVANGRARQRLWPNSRSRASSQQRFEMAPSWSMAMTEPPGARLRSACRADRGEYFRDAETRTALSSTKFRFTQAGPNVARRPHAVGGRLTADALRKGASSRRHTSTKKERYSVQRFTCPRRLQEPPRATTSRTWSEDQSVAPDRELGIYRRSIRWPRPRAA